MIVSQDHSIWTTAMCSPTRAALMTGRIHNRVGFGHNSKHFHIVRKQSS